MSLVYSTPSFNDVLLVNGVADNDAEFTDSFGTIFGTGRDSKIYYNGTNLMIDPAIVGSGRVDTNGSDLKAFALGLAGANPSAAAIVNVSFTSTTITRSLLFSQTYNGSSTAELTPFSLTCTHQGSGNTAQFANVANSRLDANGSGGATMTGLRGEATIVSTRTLSQSAQFLFIGIHGDFGANANSHTNATIRQIAVYGDTTNGYTAGSGATVTKWAGLFNDDVQLNSGAKLILEGTISTKGDTYFDFNSTTANKIRVVVDGTNMIDFRAATINLADSINFVGNTGTGNKIGTATTQKFGFFNAAPVAQQAAATDLGTALSNLGFRAAGTAYPITTSGAVNLTGGVTISTANLTVTDVNVVLSATTGTKFGTATSQKLAFFNSTPIVQPGATTDLGTVLSDLGLRAAGTAYPITTSGAVNFTGGLTIATTNLTITDKDVALSTSTGTKIGTGTTQKLGFWNAAPVIQPSSTGTTTTGYTANASANAVFAESTFTGNTGSTAYTISDIVKNLKTAGLLAA